MLQAMPRSNAQGCCNVALARTYVRNERTNRESWLRTREILTFRNARAHIRDFSSATPKATR